MGFEPKAYNFQSYIVSTVTNAFPYFKFIKLIIYQNIIMETLLDILSWLNNIRRYSI